MFIELSDIFQTVCWADPINKPTLAPKDTKADALLLTEGFLLGAIDAEGFTDIEKCIGDGEHIVQDAEKAFTDFKSKDVKDVVDGLKQVADALTYIKAGMKDCSSMKADWAKLEAIAENFASPTALAWHVGKDIVVNHVEITKEIQTSIEDYDKKDWKDFGYQVGKAAAQVLLGEASPNHVKNSAQNLFLY